MQVNQEFSQSKNSYLFPSTLSNIVVGRHYCDTTDRIGHRYCRYHYLAVSVSERCSTTFLQIF